MRRLSCPRNDGFEFGRRQRKSEPDRDPAHIDRVLWSGKDFSPRLPACDSRAETRARHHSIGYTAFTNNKGSRSMGQSIPRFADVAAAATRIKGVALETPLIESPVLNERVR